MVMYLIVLPIEVNTTLPTFCTQDFDKNWRKYISRYTFYSIEDFNKLRVALRQLERDHIPKKSTTKPSTAKASTSVKQTDFQEHKGMVKQLTHTVAELKQQQQNPTNNYQPNQTPGIYQPNQT